MKPFILSKSDRTLCETILKTHSVTYYYSTKLFPRDIQDAVCVLYAWVRTADEFVDNPKQNPQEALAAFETTYTNALENRTKPDRITALFIQLSKHASFDKQWPHAFLASMKLDLNADYNYNTREELYCYTYGSAEIIGLMMARIMGVEKKYDQEARTLGLWMQLVNFLHDIKEDYELRKRVYIPLDILAQYKIDPNNLFSQNTKHSLCRLVTEEANRLETMIPAIRANIRHIPSPSQQAVGLSVELYIWTLQQIRKNPALVCTRQVKPPLPIVFWFAMRQFFKFTQ